MEWKSIKGQIIEFLKKYRFAALILALGLVLMMLPSGKTGQEVEAEPEATVPTLDSMEERLELILSQIQGAGKVRVLLSNSSGEQVIYQTNEDLVTGTDSSTIRQDTVMVTDSQRAQSGLIKQIIPPTYLGAIILCQGADSATVRYAIADAVSKITGLGTDRISILKMK